MRKPGILTALAVLILALTACGSGNTQTTEQSESEVVESVQSGNPQSEETVPLVAKVVEEEPEGTPEDLFLQAYRDFNKKPGGTQIPDATDEQLIAAGWEACEQLAGGATVEEVRVVEGETPNEGGSYIDSLAIATSARNQLCD